MVCASDGQWKIPKTSFISSANVGFGYIVPAEHHAAGYAGHINIWARSSNIDKEYVKTSLASVNHHLQVIVA